MTRANSAYRRENRPVTALDVAQKVGVSRAAVCMAINGTGRISVKRRHQIQRVAREMGYYPCAGGQLLRRSRERSGQWGAIISSPAHRIFSGVGLSVAMTSFIEDCVSRGQRYVIEYTHYQPDEGEIKPPHQVASSLVDGSLVIGNVGPGLRRWLDERPGYPWVSLYEPARFCALSADHRGYYAGMRELVRLGHRRIACPSGSLVHLTHRLRAAGMRHAIRRLGLTIPPDWRAELEEDPQLHYDWARRVLDAPADRRPTAIFCSGVTVARTTILAAAELGLRVPEDLSIIAWGTPWDAACIHPRLTGVVVDWQALTAAAIDLLRERLDGRDESVHRPRRWVLPRIFDGDTLAPPREA